MHYLYIVSEIIPISELGIFHKWSILKRPTANDGEMAEVSTTDMRVFNMLNDPPPECKNNRKLLEIALIYKYGISYWKIFNTSHQLML